MTGQPDDGSAQLVLFDIDQTLIYTAGAGLRCMARAVREVTGVDMARLALHPGGKTDPAILDEVLEQGGFDLNGRANQVHGDVWRRYAEYLRADMAREDGRRAVKPGVRALLDALGSRPGCVLGLLTGNREDTARVKLAAFDLNRYFPVGGFGSDSPNRNLLGRIALERARAHYAVALEPARTWVVGDTDRDIAAGRAMGARVLAVATGHQTVAELARHGPDAVLPELSDLAQVLGILGA